MTNISVQPFSAFQASISSTAVDIFSGAYIIYLNSRAK